MVIAHNLSGVAVDKAFIKKTASVILQGEKKNSQDISIVLVNAGKMKALNQQYRRQNKPTDVLTFPELDIVICPKVIKDNAKAAKAAFRNELARVIIHGVLHFLDYDHEKTEKEAKVMQDKEEKYFKLKTKNEK